MKKYLKKIARLERFIWITLMKLKGVSFGKGCLVVGKPLIKNFGTLSFGNHCVVKSRYSENPIGGQSITSLVVQRGAELTIGDHAGIANSAIFCSTKIDIEESVFIGGDCKIFDTNFHSIYPQYRIFGVTDTDIQTAPVRIKAHAFIGAGSIILKGVTIGENVVVGAGSVVTKSIPDNQIWGGNPAKFIRDL